MATLSDFAFYTVTLLTFSGVVGVALRWSERAIALRLFSLLRGVAHSNQHFLVSKFIRL